MDIPTVTVGNGTALGILSALDITLRFLLSAMMLFLGSLAYTTKSSSEESM